MVRTADPTKDLMPCGHYFSDRQKSGRRDCMNLKEPLSDWIRQFAWDAISIKEDMMSEARDNLERFNCATEQATFLDADDICAFCDTYADIKTQQLINDYESHKMIRYVWLDEMAGSLCIGLI